MSPTPVRTASSRRLPLSVILFCAILGLASLDAVNGAAKCKQCSSTSYVSCQNETAYKICFDGVTESTVEGVCPEGQVCTNEQGVCKPKDTNPPACGVCDQCASGFRCVSQTQFEYCDGATPTGIVGKCDHGQYCSIANVVLKHNICIPSCGAQPTCYAAEVEAPTTPAPDISTICEGKPGAGEVYENVYDSTCTSYVHCELYNGNMVSIKYTCSSGLYFSQDLLKCVAKKPTRCA